MSVFVDTSALLALLVADDDGHGRAMRGRPAIEGAKLVTHVSVVAESLALMRRVGPTAAARSVDEMLPALDVVDTDAELRAAMVWSWRASIGTSVSFVDHATFVAMRHAGLTRAWALDADFERAGFELVA